MENSKDCQNKENECILEKDKSSLDEGINDTENENTASIEDSENIDLLANLELSDQTLKALQEFMQEEKERKEKLRQIEEGNIPQDFEEIWVILIGCCFFRV